MPVIRVTGMAYGKRWSPDLDAQEAFLTHFGMVKANRTKNALYMRGTDPVHHIHVTENDAPGFTGSRLPERQERLASAADTRGAHLLVGQTPSAHSRSAS